jgi:hypothetical protein
LIAQAAAQEQRRPLPDDVQKLFSVRVYRYSCKKPKFYDGRFDCMFDLGPAAGDDDTRKIVERQLIFIDSSWQFWRYPPYSMPF